MEMAAGTINSLPKKNAKSAQTLKSAKRSHNQNTSQQPRDHGSHNKSLARYNQNHISTPPRKQSKSSRPILG